MTKKNLLKRVAFFALLLCIVSTNLLAQTVTIGTATTVTRFPFNYWYGYGRSSNIYLASEVGNTAGTKTIYKIRWYSDLTTGFFTGPTKIFLKSTAATTQTATTWAADSTGSTQIYGGAGGQNPVWANGWNEFTLSVPFALASGQNLEVLTYCDFGGGGTGGSAGNSYRFTAATGMHQYWQTDNAPPTANGTIATSRANLQLDTALASGCSGTPSAGTITGPASACSAVAFSLTNAGASAASNIKYSWQKSTDNVAWTNLTNTSSVNTVISTSQTVVTYYRMVDTCTTSGLSAISNVLQVTMNAPTQCYCVSSASSVGDEDITNVTFGTINNTSACASLTGTQGVGTGTADLYTNFTGTVPAPSIQAGTSIPYSIQITECAATAYGHEVKVFIDFNQNGSLDDAGESFTIFALTSVNTHTITGNIAIPAGALAGNTRMRIICKEAAVTSSCGSSSYGETEDYTITIVAAPACSGTPVAGTITAPSAACPGAIINMSVSGQSVGTGLTYQWQSSPAGANTFTNIGGATNSSLTTSITAATDFQCIVTCSNGGASATTPLVTITLQTTGCPPINDEACGAIALVVDGPQECGNTTTATSNGDPAFGASCSTPNNTLWYKFTPSVTGKYGISIIPPATGDTLRGWLGVFVSSTPCPTLTYADSTNVVFGSSGLCYGFGAAGQGTVSYLGTFTAGKTYYFMMDGNSGDVGQYCIKIFTPPALPNCTTNTTPANNATGVTSVTGGVDLVWNAAPGATGYDIYFGTVNPPVTNLGTTGAVTTIKITGVSYNTKYYWYVAPRNVSGPATGCVTSTFAFTTEVPPMNCQPTYGASSCTAGDTLKRVKLVGEVGGVDIDNNSLCSSANGGYEDYTMNGNLPFLAAGTSYSGLFTVTDAANYVTIWIDFNDNGYFEDNERLLNNLRSSGAGTPTPFTVYIPVGAAQGSHRMRVRNVYYATAPTTVTDACNPYTYGETEDYTVLVQSDPPAAYTVSDGTNNACFTGGKISIDPASNNNTVFVPILDGNGKLIASVNANGTNLGNVSIAEYINSGTVRTSANGIKYLDRNIMITPEKQPVDVPVTVRLYLKAAELAALSAAAPSVTGIGSVNVTKTTQACAALAGAGTLFTQTGNGTLGSDYYVQISIPSFSSFYLHGGTVALPVNYAELTGIRNGNKVDLTWITRTETNNRSFEIQRSADGRSFTAMGSINSKAAGGNSVLPINYNFTDVLPLVVTNYYRLKQTDIDGKTTYSNTVLVKGIKPTVFSLNTIFPNPAKERIMAALQSPFADNITLVVTDITGKIIKKQVVNMAIGDNLVSVDVASLPGGSYLLKAVCNNGCESAVWKFTKQ